LVVWRGHGGTKFCAAMAMRGVASCGGMVVSRVLSCAGGRVRRKKGRAVFKGYAEILAASVWKATVRIAAAVSDGPDRGGSGSRNGFV
jgi:hypothetical protein